MHVPRSKPLASWIRELEASGELYKFYNSPEWKALAAVVMRDHHNECEDCADAGEYSPAQTVHHEYEVREHPELALTRYIEDGDGELREILHALCNRCHNKRHGRFGGSVSSRKKFTNTERW